MKHFQNIGLFAQAVREASRSNGQADPRLIANAPSTFGSEGIGEDGGFAVPGRFADEIFATVKSESLLGQVDLIEVDTNNITLPADQTAPWTNDSGIRVLWGDEAQQMTQSKPKLSQKSLRLHSLYALVPITNELLEDAALLSGYLQSRVAEKIAFRVTEAIIRGSGAGQPSGILGASGTISVAKDTSTSPIQPADTVRHKNVVDMWSRLNAIGRKRAVWLVNPDVESALGDMFLDPSVATPAASPVYDAASRTLMGRPIVATEAASKLGDAGDIILGDLSQYLLLMKTGGIQQDFSLDCWFDFDISAFRFRFRVAGLPWLNAPVTPPYSSTTRSDFVTLAAR
jgi:HK97 family phage major capsid protein